MQETAGRPTQTDKIAGPDEVRQAISALTDGELLKLQRLAEQAIFRLRRKVWGVDGRDLLHDAVLRLLNEKRRWKPKRVDLVGQLAGIIASIDSDWLKRGKRAEIPVLETDLVREDADGAEVPTPLELAADPRPDPQKAMLANEELTQEQLFHQIADLFAEDALASLIFSEWQRGTSGTEIMKGLGLERQQYDTAVRRMDRAIQKRWPEGMPHVH